MQDYVKLMWLIRTDKPDDWVIATGVTTFRDFVVMAFKVVGINIEFKGIGINEKAMLLFIKNIKLKKEQM